MNKLFEMATRNKFRFAFRGMVSVEDLWDLKLEQLDEVYRNLMAEIKKASEESLLKTKTKSQTELESKVEIVKYIVEVKLKEKDDREKAKENKEKKQRIAEILNEKDNEDLKNKTREELRLMLDSLE